MGAPPPEGLPKPSGAALIPSAGSRRFVGSPQGLKPSASSPATSTCDDPS